MEQFKPQLSPEDIVKILHSFTKITVDIPCDDIECYFDDCTVPMVSREFLKDSFTRDLIELIGWHLLGPNI